MVSEIIMMGNTYVIYICFNICIMHFHADVKKDDVEKKVIIKINVNKKEQM